MRRRPLSGALALALVVGFALPRLAGAQPPPVDTVSYSLASSQFKAISFPFTVADSSVGSVFPSLGPADHTQWRMFSWSALDSGYLELGTSGKLDVGEGYWIVTRGSSSLTSLGTVPVPSNPIRLNVSRNGARPAWNFVGYPNSAPLAVTAVLVSTPLFVFGLTSPSNTITEHVMKEWNPATSSYINANVLQPGTAYWVRALVPGVSVLINISPPAPSAVGAGLGTETAAPEGPDWAVSVVARQGERLTEPIMLGAAPVAAGEWNSLDLAKAPDPPARHVRLYLPEPGWGRMSGDYVREFQPQAETMTWEFVAQAAEVPGEVALDFSASDVPSGTTLWLTDLRDGWTREVRAGQSVTFPATGDARRFRLVATAAGGQQSATPLANTLRYAYPNPFVTASGLAFTLAQPGRIVVAIYDVQGRRVQRLDRESLSAGERVVVWDGRDADGTTAPAGFYMARYQVGEKKGTTRLVKLR